MQAASDVPAQWANIQGNISPGFKKDHQAFVLVSFPDARSGRLWLKLIAPELASSSEVSAFNELYKTVNARLPGEALRVINARWVNVALSWQGLATIGALTAGDPFPATFRTNRVPFAESAASNEAPAHALLLLAADRPEDLQADVDRQRDLLRRSGARALRVLEGHALTGTMRGHEHFGFKDLIADPVIAGSPEASAPNADVVPAGQFILGAPGPGKHASMGHPLLNQASFLAFVQLDQKVGAFRSAIDSQAASVGIGRPDLAAAIVGRRADGTPFGASPSRLSHVGRARGAWLPRTETDRRRILRRGIPFGPALPDAAADDGAARGLFFLSYQADLMEQFEHVWLKWLNSADVPYPSGGADGLVGQPDGPSGGAYRNGSAAPTRAVAVDPAIPAPAGRGPLRLRLPQFVRPRYGAYFLAPSRSAVALLGAGSAMPATPAYF
jgi:deferrochelatase/peroxidase EfeB